MFLFRLTKKAHTSLDGVGGLFLAGRWNNKGIRVVYLSSTRSLTILENLVHLSDPGLIPPDMVIMKIHIPDTIKPVILDESILSKTWKSNQLETRHLGSKFINGNEHLLLRVPSAIVDEEYNYLFNPAHPDAAKCSFIAVDPFLFDPRLIK